MPHFLGKGKFINQCFLFRIIIMFFQKVTNIAYDILTIFQGKASVLLRNIVVKPYCADYLESKIL